MMKHWIRLAVVVVVVGGAGLALARSGGAPLSRTGAPALGGISAEGLCTGCHGGNALNSGGSVQVLDAPALYRQGNTYRLRVRLTSSQTAAATGRRWAFQLTAVNTSAGTGAGTFANVAGQATQISTGSGSYSTRSYVEETDTGMKDGVASPVEWLVDWTAPNATIPVSFYVTGVAADGSGNTSGDWVYTGSVAVADTTTPASAASWGRVKSLYRR
jgi:hypothetical protein